MTRLKALIKKPLNLLDNINFEPNMESRSGSITALTSLLIN